MNEVSTMQNIVREIKQWPNQHKTGHNIKSLESFFLYMKDSFDQFMKPC